MPGQTKWTIERLSAPRTMTATEAAYVAGFIDGEGSLMLVRTARPYQSRASVRYHAAIQIANTHLPTLRRVLRMCGVGRITLTGSKPQHRTGYAVSLTPHQIRVVLPQVQPYLITKRRQAHILIEALELLGKGDSSEARWKRLAELRARLQTLNMRGPARRIRAEKITVRSSRAGVNQYTDRPARLCSVNGCGRKHYAQGYCKRHYKLYVTRGGPARHVKRCKACDAEFTSKRIDAQFCSRSCADRTLYVERRKVS